MVHHDLWDYDAAAAPQLITVKHNGRTIDAVAQATKQGFLFAFDRVTGKPLWPIKSARCPRPTYRVRPPRPHSRSRGCFRPTAASDLPSTISTLIT
jgi:quinoprotein glucose dehydrogenase